MTSHAGSGFGGSRGSLGGDSHQRTVRGVFVSHASEGLPLAAAFCELIHDASAGLISTYSSFTQDPTSGIAWLARFVSYRSSLPPASLARSWPRNLHWKSPTPWSPGACGRC